MVAREPFAEEDAVLFEVEFDECPGDQVQALPHLDGHGDLTFGGNGASHR